MCVYVYMACGVCGMMYTRGGVCGLCVCVLWEVYVVFICSVVWCVFCGVCMWYGVVYIW